MSVLLLIVFGAAAGFIATRAMGLRANIVVTSAVGIAGVLIGGIGLQFVTSILGATAGFFFGILAVIVSGTLAAVLLIWLYLKVKR